MKNRHMPIKAKMMLRERCIIVAHYHPNKMEYRVSIFHFSKK